MAITYGGAAPLRNACTSPRMVSASGYRWAFANARARFTTASTAAAPVASAGACWVAAETYVLSQAGEGWIPLPEIR